MSDSTFVGVGTSALHDARAAGAQAARAAAAGLRAPGLALVFGRPALDPAALLEGVRAALGETPLAGCSVGSGGARVSVAAVGAALECRTYLVGGAGRDARAAARALVARLGCHAAEGGLLLVFPDGATTDGTALQAELVRALPSTVRIAGGMAGAEADDGPGRAWQVHDGRADSGALSAALLTGGLEALALTRAALEPVLAALEPLGPPRTPAQRATPSG